MRATNLQLEARAARTTELPEARRCDRLTGLFNRGYLDLVLRRELQAATMGEWPLSVAFVSLEHIGRINEAYGREAGGLRARKHGEVDCIGGERHRLRRALRRHRFRDRTAGSGVTRRQNILRAPDRPPGEQRPYDRRHGGNRARLSGTRHLRSGEAVSTRLPSDPCRRAPGAFQREIAPRSTPARRGGPGPAVKEQSSVEAGRGGRLTGLTSR